jgi:hypothetical protein
MSDVEAIAEVSVRPYGLIISLKCPTILHDNSVLRDSGFQGGEEVDVGIVDCKAV